MKEELIWRRVVVEVNAGGNGGRESYGLDNVMYERKINKNKEKDIHIQMG